MPSIQHMIILAIIILVLFGRGKVSELMGDFGKGIKSFKAGMNEEANSPATPPPAQIPAPPTADQATLNGETVVDGSASKPQ